MGGKKAPMPVGAKSGLRPMRIFAEVRRERQEHKTAKRKNTVRGPQQAPSGELQTFVLAAHPELFSEPLSPARTQQYCQVAARLLISSLTKGPSSLQVNLSAGEGSQEMNGVKRLPSYKTRRMGYLLDSGDPKMLYSSRWRIIRGI